MSRFLVTFSGTILTAGGRVDRDAIDRVTDEVLDELLHVRELIDPDAGATMSAGLVEFMVTVEAETPRPRSRSSPIISGAPSRRPSAARVSM